MNPDAVEAAIYSILSGDATLGALETGGIWNGRVPPTATAPYLRFNLQPSPAEAYTFAGARITELVYEFDAVVAGYSKKPARDALARVDVLLKDANLSLTGGTLLYCRRAGFGPGDITEEVDGVVYQMCRVTYRIIAQPS